MWKIVRALFTHDEPFQGTLLSKAASVKGAVNKVLFWTSCDLEAGGTKGLSKKSGRWIAA